MNQQRENSEVQKPKIKTQIKELSRLLGMVPLNSEVKMQDPVTQYDVELSNWLSETRDSFLKLSLLISKELDIAIGETKLISENPSDELDGKS